MKGKKKRMRAIDRGEEGNSGVGRAEEKKEKS